MVMLLAGPIIPLAGTPQATLGPIFQRGRPSLPYGEPSGDVPKRLPCPVGSQPGWAFTLEAAELEASRLASEHIRQVNHTTNLAETHHHYAWGPDCATVSDDPV